MWVLLLQALEILKTKKGGNYIIIKANANYKPPKTEYREVYGVCFAQDRNNTQLTCKYMCIFCDISMLY